MATTVEVSAWYPGAAGSLGGVAVWNDEHASGLTAGRTNGVRAKRRMPGNVDADGKVFTSTEAVVAGDGGVLFSVGGDSGSLVVSTAGSMVLGLIFGGDKEKKYLFTRRHKFCERAFGA